MLPFRFAHVARWLRRPSPSLGQHNDEVLAELGVDVDVRERSPQDTGDRRSPGRRVTRTGVRRVGRRIERRLNG